MEISRGEMHSENERRDQAKIQNRHRPALCGCDFVIALFFFGALAEERYDTWQGWKHHQPDDEVWIFPAKPDEHGKSRQPEPARKRGRNSSAIQHSDRREIEKVQ